MMLEAVDRRVLGAVAFVDAPTGARIDIRLEIHANGARFLQNPSGLYVVMSARGLESMTTLWETQPVSPPVGSVQLGLQVSDPGAHYLPRRALISLPRDPAAANAAQPTSLFAPAVVAMFPAPAARTAPGWAIVRASIRSKAAGAPPIGGALVRVVRTSDSVLLASGVSDGHGEALVAVAGLPRFNVGGGNGPVLSSQVQVTVQAVADSNLQPPIDPDDLELRHTALPGDSRNASLTAGQAIAVSLSI